MSDPQTSAEKTAGTGDEARLAALFAQFVMQQSNMAMMLLGKVEHPETGKAVKDLEAARFFIDGLEMLEVKTKGNLSKEESAFLKQSLMTLRLAFVEAVEAPAPKAEPAPQPKQESAQPAAGAPAPESGSPTPAEEEHRKKFSKKY